MPDAYKRLSVLSSPPGSTDVDPSRGDMLETEISARDIASCTKKESEENRGKEHFRFETRWSGTAQGPLNKVTTEVRAAAAALVDDPQYRQKLLHDMRKRRVSPPVEVMLWAYACGKPVERVEIGRAGDFSKMS